MKKRKVSFKQVFKEIISTVVLALIIALLIIKFIGSTTIVDGISMEPTLKTNDFILVNRIGFLLGDLEPGDIIQFHSPNNKKKDFIKRVIAVEGDTVEIKNNRVFVNGNELVENYTMTKGITGYKDEKHWEIGKDEVFVLGDNRDYSNDSRTFGPIKKDSIVGIAFLRIYPFKEIKKF
ncbi:signal peptidase I [Miniphocaeibacter halophilus]|uniref:Signal peptidase I n=1 Tax=Miniphocaeibacter halophilus TaxID=2931922 RepID=A0AC61MRM2_9FIRM|nr:signal peptidase I [Miniphocaeibacter halophilus]QQK08232.1 signal peptidase I [Miniphocaeibacter halophilus]